MAWPRNHTAKLDARTVKTIRLQRNVAIRGRYPANRYYASTPCRNDAPVRRAASRACS
jgi:hypothetical protein